jgi:hypothetical protein
MRKCLLAGVVCLGLAVPARAQQATSFFTGVNPKQLTNKTVDLSHAGTGLNPAGALHPLTQPKPFSLANIFQPFSLPTFPPRSAQSTFPASIAQRQAAMATLMANPPVFPNSSSLPTMTVGTSPFGIPGLGH